MTNVLNIRIPPEMAAALKERERLTDVPTCRFVRKAIALALDPFEQDDAQPDAADEAALARAVAKEKQK